MSVPCLWQTAHVCCKYVPACPSPKCDGLVILPPDTIILYKAMYVDPVRLSVTKDWCDRGITCLTTVRVDL